MKTRRLSEDQFLKEVSDHRLAVIRDDGMYRHLRLQAPNSSCMFFDLVTWPGYLAYSGDMGCYVFSRITDMFDFFRGEIEGSLKINPQYWSEKLQAVDGNRSNGCATEFSPEKFKRVIQEIRLNWIREDRDSTNKQDRRELWELVDSEILSSVGDVAPAVSYNAAYNFFFESDSGKTFQFDDLFEYDFDEYTHRFIWCCYAMAWGIRQYDLAEAKE